MGMGLKLEVPMRMGSLDEDEDEEVVSGDEVSTITAGGERLVVNFRLRELLPEVD